MGSDRSLTEPGSREHRLGLGWVRVHERLDLPGELFEELPQRLFLWLARRNGPHDLRARERVRLLEIGNRRHDWRKLGAE